MAGVKEMGLFLRETGIRLQVIGPDGKAERSYVNNDGRPASGVISGSAEQIAAVVKNAVSPGQVGVKQPGQSRI